MRLAPNKSHPAASRHTITLKNSAVALSVLIGSAVAPRLSACDLCSVYSAAQASGLGGQGVYAGIAEQYTYSSTLQENGRRIHNDDHEYIRSSYAQLFAGYSFNSRLSLQLNLPVIGRYYGWAGTHGHDWGAGDLSLNAVARPWHYGTEDCTLDWHLLGGIKFPTGDSSWLGPRGKAITAVGIGGHDLALGSGSYDGLVGTSFSARWKRVFFNANAQYAIRSEGDFAHRYANDLTWCGGPGFYLALNEDYTIGLQAMVSGETKGKDMEDGVPDPDSAVTLVYVGPQVNVTWSDKASFQLGFDLPVSRGNSEFQVLPDYRLRAAFNWHF